ncbi:MAG: hypothetical protein Tsb004_30520 [Allomuricauda sp.]
MKKYYLLIVIVIFIIYSVYKTFSKSNQLKSDGEYTVGKIVKFKHNQKSSYTFYYTYVVEGKVYKSNKASSYFECNPDNSGCVGVEYRVIYSKSNPEISDIDLKSNNKYKRSHLFF